MATTDERNHGGGGKRRKKNKGGGVTWQGFVDCVLDKKDKEALRALDLVVEYPYEDLPRLVADGYKVTFSYSEGQGTHVCTLTDQNPGSDFAGYSLSGRSDSLHKAYGTVMYKHLVVWGDGWRHKISGGGAEEFS